MNKISIFLIVLFACNQPKKYDPHPITTDQEIQKRQPMEYDIYKLIRKPPDSISKILGNPNVIIKKPKDCATLKYCVEMDYKHGLITILYKDNQALWFEFDSLFDHTWEYLPAILGLPNSPPSYVEDETALYHDVFRGINQIAFVKSKSHYGMVSWIALSVE